MINLLLGLGVATTLLTTVAPAKNNTPSDNSNVTFTGDEAKDYAQKMNIENVENINSITIVYSGEQSEKDMPELAYHGNDYYIKDNTIKTYEQTGDRIRCSSYQGESTATMTVTETLSSTFEFSFEISNDILKAKLGYSRTYSFTVSDSYSIHIPANKTKIIECYVWNEVKEFEIWEDDLFFDDYVGIYHSYKPIGVAFVTRDK